MSSCQTLNGLELQEELHARAMRIPIVFITGHGDIPMSVRAMKAGAVDFLAKPFQDEDLLRAVQEAIARDEAPGPGCRTRRCLPSFT